MGDERRTHERHPSFEIINVKTLNAAGIEKTLPVMLRDKSYLGMGGVYVGQEPLNMDDAYYFREANGTLKNMRLVWINRVADFVHVLGFLIIEE